MNVKFAVQSAKEFVSQRSAFGKIEIEISKPWHFNHCRGTNIPFQNEGKGGIYLLSEPGVPWEISADSNDRPVWYIGKSATNVGGRVWGHFGSVNDPETGFPCIPRFKYHRWANVNSVPEAVLCSVSKGDIVVYSLAIRSVDESQIWLLSELLEKYVLVQYVMASGARPLLNLQL